MPLQSPVQYGFTFARLRGQRGRLLSAGEYERLIAAEELDELVRGLAGTAYGDDISAIPQEQLDSEEFDRLLRGNFAKALNTLRRGLPGYSQPIINLYFQRFFVDGLKTVIRGLHAGITKEETLRLVVTFSENERQELESLYESGWPSLVEQVSDRDIRRALIETQEDYEQKPNSLTIEMALDRDYYSRLVAKAEDLPSSDRQAVLRIIGTQIELLNVSVLLRAKYLNLPISWTRKSLIPVNNLLKKHTMEQLIGSASILELLNVLRETPYEDFARNLADLFEKEKSLKKLDQVVDQYLAHESQRMWRGVPFHLGVFLSFAFLRSLELKNLRGIWEAKALDLPTEMIRELVLYV